MGRREPVRTGTYHSDTIDRAKSGDDEAWRIIVAEFGPVIRGLAIAKGAPDPDDLTQDVFVAVAKRIKRFEGDPVAFRTWVFSIAYRQIVNRWRQRQKQTAQLTLDPVDESRGPEDATIAETVVDAAVSALDVLSEVERDIVVLSVITELGSEEIAEITDKTPGNVRVIKTRALHKLRLALRERGYARVGNMERKAG